MIVALRCYWQEGRMYGRTELTQTVAAKIAAQLRRDGWQDVDTRDVWIVWDCATHTNEALASAILQEFPRLRVTA